MKTKLGPVLTNCYLWELFVRPLFEFTLPIDYFECTSSRKNELRRLLRRTFKNFTKIAKTTPDNLISALCGYDLDSRSQEVVQEQAHKWISRASSWNKVLRERSTLLLIIKEDPELKDDE
jgi:hypothetical protein